MRVCAWLSAVCSFSHLIPPHPCEESGILTPILQMWVEALRAEMTRWVLNTGWDRNPAFHLSQGSTDPPTCPPGKAAEPEGGPTPPPPTCHPSRCPLAEPGTPLVSQEIPRLQAQWDGRSPVLGGSGPHWLLRLGRRHPGPLRPHTWPHAHPAQTRKGPQRGKQIATGVFAGRGLPPAPGQHHLLPDSGRQEDKRRAGAAGQGRGAREQAREPA